ncbi:hypothetical protein TNCV_3749911 [Trichonephila clavipes]|nr:hypothetical protein TNCV_3749911 [Trichonephila clavipes]
MSRQHVAKLCRSFQSGRQDVENRNMVESGRPSFSKTVTPSQPRFDTQGLFSVSEGKGALIRQTVLFRQCYENIRRDLDQWAGT